MNNSDTSTTGSGRLPQRSVAIVGGRVVPVVGEPIDGGTVIIDDGVITEVGRDVEVPQGSEIIDATGTWVLPGLVEAHSHLGVHEEGVGWAGHDFNEMTGPNQAAVRALDAINIEEEGFRDAIRAGVTTAVIKPGSGNPIGGLTCAVKTWGGRTVDEQVIKAEVSVKSALGENAKRTYGERKVIPQTRLGVAKVIREAFTNAQNHMQKADLAHLENTPAEAGLELDTLAAVLRGDVVWDQHAHRHDDIATAIRLSEEFGYTLVVNHGTEGHLIADVLAEKGIPVIYGPTLTSRNKVELAERGLSNLVHMAHQGVAVALTTDHPVVPIDHLITQAILAVKEGLDPALAVEAMTINPARFMRLDDRVGALRPGMDADVVLWSGDPLDTSSRVLTTLINGTAVYSANHGVTERMGRFNR